MKRYYYLLSIVLLWMVQNIGGQDGLVGYWSFDTLRNDTFTDHSEFANHGTNRGADLIEGVKGKALSFDGRSDYAIIQNEEKSPPEILRDLGYGSISVWFRVEHIPPENGIAPIFYYGAGPMCDFFDAANQGMIIEVGHSPIHYGSENLYFTIWKNGCTFPSFCYDTGFPIEKGVWHHFVAVVGENFNTGYLNGKEIVNRRYNFGTPSYSQFFEDAVEHDVLWLGLGHWDRTIQHFQGAIDELRIYNRPLRPGEVSQLYNSPDKLLLNLPELSGETPEVRFYPNPANGFLNFNINEPVDRYKIIISDLKGKTIVNHSGFTQQGKLELGNMNPGVYTVIFKNNEFDLEKKLIIR